MNIDLKPELRREPDGRYVERRRRALVSELRGDRRRRRPWLRRALLVVPAAGVLAAGAYAVTRDSEPPTDFVGCYPSANRQATSTASGNPDGTDPVGDCRRAWSRGEVTGSKERPPALVACTERSEIRVYPGFPRVCDRLGLSVLRPGHASRALRDRRMERNLDRGLASCLPVSAARRLARRELDSAGHRDWKLDGPDGSPPPGRPACVAGFGLGSSEGDDGEQGPSSLFLEYGSLAPTARERRQFDADERVATRDNCRAGSEPGAAGALARVECRLSFDTERCQDPRRAAAALRSELRRRGMTTQVTLDLDIPGRCWDDTQPLDANGEEIEAFDRSDKPRTLRLLTVPR